MILVVGVRDAPYPSESWSTAPHAVVLTLMREHYYCVYLYMLSVDVLTHAVDLHKTLVGSESMMFRC